MLPFTDIRDISTLDGASFERTCQQYARFSFLETNCTLCRVLAKYKMFVDPKDKGIVPHLMMDGFWETWVTQFMAQIIESGDVCIDVGANFGYYSILMSALSGSEGRVIAVEPNSDIANMLRHTSRLNYPYFEVAEVALSETVGNAELIVPLGYMGGASIVQQTVMEKFKTEIQKVQTLSLDALAEQSGITRVDVIKIDVEGVEPLVFKGMKQVLKNSPGIKIIMEYSPHLYEDAAGFTHYLFKEFNVYRLKDVEKITRLQRRDIPSLVALRDHTDLYLQKKNSLQKMFSFF